MAQPPIRNRAIVGTILFAVVSAYFLWVALTDSPLFRLDHRLGFVGALLFGFGAVSMARIAANPDSYKGPSLAFYFTQALEGVAYIIAMLAGLVWLIKRLSGNTTSADDLERGGVWVVGIFALLAVLRIFGVVGPDKETTKE